MLHIMVIVHEFKHGLVRLSHDGWGIPIWISTRDIAFLKDDGEWWCLIAPDLAYVYGMSQQIIRPRKLSSKASRKKEKDK